MRKKTLEAFEAWKADPLCVVELMQRVAQGETVKEVCEKIGIASSLVQQHIRRTPTLLAEYRQAQAQYGDELVHGGVNKLKNASLKAVTPEAKRLDGFVKVAGKWDRERYGERDAGLVQVNVNLGDTAREIRELEARLGLAPSLESSSLNPKIVRPEMLGAIIETPEDI